MKSVIIEPFLSLIRRIYQKVRKVITSIAEKVGWSRRTFSYFVISFFGSFVITFLLIDYISFSIKSYNVGDVADRDIKATNDFKVIDEEGTKKKNKMAEESVLPVFDYSPLTLDRLKANVEKAFSTMREKMPAINGEKRGGKERTPSKKGISGEKDKIKGGGQSIDEIKDEFFEILGVAIPDIFFENLLVNRFGIEIENDLYELLNMAYSYYIIQTKTDLPYEINKGITLIDIDTSSPEKVLTDIEKIKDIKEIEKMVSFSAYERIKRKPYIIDTELNILRSILKANITFNARETDERRKEALSRVGIATINIKKGRVIVRKGDPITEEHIKILNSIRKAKSQIPYWQVFLIIYMMIFLMNFIVFKFSSTFIKKFSANPKDALTLITILSLILGIVRISGETMTSIYGTTYHHNTFPDYYYLIPVAAGTMLVRLILNSETAIVFAIVSSMLSGFLSDNSLLMMFYYFLGSVTAAAGVGHTKERVKIFNAGLITSGVNIVMIILITGVNAYLSTGETLSGGYLLYNILLGAGGGILTSIVVLGLVPLFEIFGYVTDSKLLELANFNNPILRKLMFHAPGTYHHSLILGTLSEAAAEATHANALLCRVASFYHDIGKLKKPMYFIENYPEEENRHHKLSPSMSTLIILSHVRDGVEMAREYRLPKIIIDMIQQHHGTRLVRYFYSIAKDNERPDIQKVDETEFRYKGPKPRTKEAGIILLGDAVEAATRALKNPTPAKIEARIEEVFKEVLDDNQLEECPITLKDISLIKKIFRNMLVGIFHQRIEYPDVKVVKQPGKTVSVSRKGVVTHEWSVTPTPQEGAIKVKTCEESKESESRIPKKEESGEG